MVTRSSLWAAGKKVGSGGRRNWAAGQSQQRSQPALTGALKLGWPFRLPQAEVRELAFTFLVIGCSLPPRKEWEVHMSSFQPRLSKDWELFIHILYNLTPSGGTSTLPCPCFCL